MKEQNDLRIGQFLSRAGLCRRRDADIFLQENKVTLNGRWLKDLNERLPLTATLEVNGQSASLQPTDFVILLNKPVKYTCSHKEQLDQKSIFRLLPKEHKNIFFAGRLDVDSRGLVVLSYDGDLIFKLTHPSQQTEKEYNVILNRPVAEKEMERTLRGVFDKNEKLSFKSIEQVKPAHCRVILTEGKNREIRRVFERLGLTVRDLQRVRIGDFNLGDIPQGNFKKIDFK